MNKEDILLRAKQWTLAPFDSSTQNQTLALIKDDSPELLDCFYTDLEFGTGGMRGKMGLGPNRINEYTISMASQGLANYTKQEVPPSEWRVAIAFDSRNRSQEFAETTAKVFLANGFEVFLFEALRPTPMLSFAVRELKCTTGVVITASHNPPEYNGYKVYWNDGAQIVHPQDKAIIAEVRKVLSPEQVNIASSLDGVHYLGKEMDEAFLQESKGQLLSPEVVQKHKDMRLVFTALHGTGGVLIPDALRNMGFEAVFEVEEQAAPDGDFPSVVSPNPEESSAMKMALNLAEEKNADLVLGTDPDADRVGIAVRNSKQKMLLLNGNETGALLMYYVLYRQKELGQLPHNAFVAKTVVTSELFRQIGEHFEVGVEETLTGFKNIAAVIRALEGRAKFIVGGEESYGYMLGDFVRDKDAVTSALLIVEMAAWAKENYGSVYELLKHLHKTFGVWQERLVSLKKEGIEGKQAIADMMENFRKQPPSTLAGIEVEAIDDLRSSERLFLDGRRAPLAMEKSNVVQFRLAGGGIVTARPSGTEPKIKFYFSLRNEFNPAEDYELQRKNLNELIDKMEADFLA